MLTPESVAQFGPEYFSAVRNPEWANAEHTVIVCEVNFKHLPYEEWTPFAADPNDYMPYSKMIFDRAAAGEFGAVVEYVAPPESGMYFPGVAAENQPVSTGSQSF